MVERVRRNEKNRKQKQIKRMGSERILTHHKEKRVQTKFIIMINGHNTEIVSVINELDNKSNTINNLIDEVKTTREDLIQFSRQVLFPNHYGTNPLFLKGITDEVKDELRRFLFPNHYNTTYVYKG
ncbi:hypothetical protein N9L64_06595 [Flavobacteriaceae bacterium]|nr:hypothetical protein [Flavobacteriaceae bacterium]